MESESGLVRLRGAAAFKDPSLRALDAVHLATALSIGDDPDAFVTYDATYVMDGRGERRDPAWFAHSAVRRRYMDSSLTATPATSRHLLDPARA